MFSVRVDLFGPFCVHGDLGSLSAHDFPSRKAKQVCEVLALARGKRVSVDQLIEVLWGNKLPKNPAGTVEQNISVLRSCLSKISSRPMIVTAAGGYAFDGNVVEIDLDVFDAHISAAAGCEPLEALDGLRAAMALASGSVLEDESYADWPMSARSYYARRVERCLVNAARGAPERSPGVRRAGS
jgi:DNA-binding SARP family transcriptional activator